MPNYACSRCGFLFPSKQALGGHNARGVLTCRRVVNSSLAPATSVPAASPGHGNVVVRDNNLAERDDNFDVTGDQNDVEVPANGAVAAAAPLSTIQQLLQRPKRANHKHIIVPLDVERLSTCDTANTFKLHETQDAYKEYCDLIRSRYSDEFWKIFATVYRERAVTIDRVLKACKDAFVFGKQMKKRFEVHI